VAAPALATQNAWTEHPTIVIVVPVSIVTGADHVMPPSVERSAVPLLVTATQSELVGQETLTSEAVVITSGDDHVGGVALPASVVYWAIVPPTATHEVGLPQERLVTPNPSAGATWSTSTGAPKTGAVELARATPAAANTNSTAVRASAARLTR
jgi:hypothetical protein